MLIHYANHTTRGGLVAKPSNKIYIILLFAVLYCFELFGASLSYEDRIAAQKAIESVYWKHRLWPKENKSPKPAFEKTISAELLQFKVDDALRKSEAAEYTWKRPILPLQLQAEIDRIVIETKDPKMLQEIFDALGNNPERIAESLARPILADRLIRNWYAYDQRFHGELRSKVEKEVNTANRLNIRNLSGEYQEVDWKRSNQKSPDTDVLNSSEWGALIQKLNSAFHKSELPLNQISTLQENESEVYIMMILQKSDDAIKIGSMRWKKTSFEKWWSESKWKFHPQSSIVTSFTYKLPKLDTNGASCSLDTWTRMPSPPISERELHSAVWTGSEMIVWGGDWGLFWNTGGKYNPATDSWIPTNTTGAPQARMQHTAIWSGTEMIVWGGQGCSSGNQCFLTVLNTGGRYNPLSDTWMPTSISNGPSPSYNVLSGWTGSEMIIWGGYSGDKAPWRYNPAQDSWTAGSTVNAPNETTNSVGLWTGSELIAWGGTGGNAGPGKRYNPQTDQWTTMSTINEPEWRYSASAIWTGTEMIMWGGWGNMGIVNTGGRYNPVTDSWSPTTLNNAPPSRYAHTAVWTGTEMIVWGGADLNPPDPGSVILNDGSRYNPSTDSWIPVTLTNAPSRRASHTAVWTGTEMIVFGGGGGANTGGRYDPVSDSWVATNPTNFPRGRLLHTAIWTGTEMIAWGGRDRSFAFNSGGLYHPTTNSWTLIDDVTTVQARSDHTAIWTGTEMIVWGGKNETDGSLNSGARFNPVTMQWSLTSTLNAPETRYVHTAVWTGTEMIVFGGMTCLNPPGCFSNLVLQTGGQYNVANDEWVSTSMTNAPAKRQDHSAVWTGTEMIVWGGRGPLNTPLLNDGSRYDPSAQVWTPISSINAPSVRMNATAVWTGTDMIIWGGTDGNTELDSGGIYNPTLDSWSPTSQTNAPLGRYLHHGIWTGSDLVVWGGRSCNTPPTCEVLNTGGKYTAENDSWSAMSDINSPPPSHSHSAVWTGTQMIVWGGQPYYSEGGLYCLNPIASYLFFDDFEDGVLDSNWTYKKTWIESGGNLNGNGSSKKAIAIASPVFSGCTNCIADFVVQSSGGPLSKVWIFGWYIDKKNSLELLMREDKDLWILKDRFNGSVVSKFKVSQQIVPNVPYNVRMSYDGNQVQVFIDDFQNAVISFVPTHSLSTGTVGLKVVNTDVRLENISVY
jgi:N-acetylneuraminic acid mutarotase